MSVWFQKCSEFFNVSYDELKNLFAAKNTNGIKGFVISSSSPKSDASSYYYLNFDRRILPLPFSKNFQPETLENFNYDKYDTYLIYRF